MKAIRSVHQVTPNITKRLIISHSQVSTHLIFLAVILALPLGIRAQTDNFDSGSLSSAWTKSEFFPQSYTFPSVGSGKGLRIQANPVPSTAPAAAAITQTNNYTDFYVAVDVANWAIEDQALVVLGRWTPGGAAGLAEAAGMICNYDAAQDGDTAGDRNGGEFQINVVAPGFGTTTLAAGEVTFEPGHSYRLILKAVGTLYTAQAYDLNDLTKPLVTIQADDPTYTNGLCGFLSFSRNGIVGTTDVTIDNYYAAAADPNTAMAPVLPHPIPGTPIVASRVPAARFANFHNPSTGISFTAQTFAADQINSSATKLFLNGADLSSQLVSSPNGTSINGSLPGSALSSNTVYRARIELEDTTGLKKSTNTFWFDTFSNGYLLTTPVKTIEAEDYNYSNGVYKLEPIPVSGLDTNGSSVNLGIGYFGLFGTPEVDFSKPGGSYHFEYAEYRGEGDGMSNRVQVTQGSYSTLSRDEAADIIDTMSYLPPLRIHDTQRSQYVATNVWEYQIRLMSTGDWFNYTRVFAPTNYYVYLRCGTFGATTLYLDRVTSDPATTNQTTVRLGTFNVDNHIMRLNYKYEPLRVGSSPVVLSLSGTNTLRLTMGGTVSKDDRLVVMDYLLFVPTSDGPTLFDNFQDGNDTVNPTWDHYDPIGGLTAPPASFTVSNGVYRIQAPAPLDCSAGPSRAGSFLHGVGYSDFYVSADLIDFDDTVRQAFGIAARIVTPGLGSTGGYLFSWEPGSGTLPGTDNGDLDISRLVNEAPIGQIETAPSGLHLTRGKSYRFVFMGSGTNFEGQVYEFPDLSNPLIRLPANDPDDLYPYGQVGLIAASQSDCSVAGDATFDNFLVTRAEPRLSFGIAGGNLTLTWPLIPFRLQSSPSLSSPVWTDVTSGIVTYSDHYGYSVSPSGTSFYRLAYP